MKQRFLFVVLLISLPMQLLLAWGQKGHRIIAQVAYDNMTRSTIKKVDNILGQNGMVYWANWPDEIKSDTIFSDRYEWHFQDLDAGMSDSALIATLTDYPKVGGKMWMAIDSMISVLRSTPSDTIALRFIVHLMGDRFCPMHTAHIDDLGGNKVDMKWFHNRTNLHTVWDTWLIDSQGYSYTEYAQYLNDKYSDQKQQILDMTRADELRHNYSFTESIYAYQKQWNGNSYHYIYRFVHPMEWQLYAAGIKLAQLLNELYR